MPSLPNSFARLFTRPTTPARTAFERTRSGTGCLVEIDVKVMIRPQRLRCMCGMTSGAKYTVLMKLSSIAFRHSSMLAAKNPLAGGPPALVTHTSTLPNLSATASIKVVHRHSVGHVKSLGKYFCTGLLADFLRG